MLNRFLPDQRLATAVRISLIAILLVAIYSAAGALLLPWWLQKNLPDYSQRWLGRDASVGEIRINPFSFELSVNALSIRDSQQQTLLGWNTLYANLDPSRYPGADALIIADLQINDISALLQRDQNGEFNISDILRHLAADTVEHLQTTQSAASKKTDSSLAVKLENLALNNLRLQYQETFRPHPAALRSDRNSVNYELAGNIRGTNLHSGNNQPPGTFDAQLQLNPADNSNAGVSINSSVQLSPLTAQGRIVLNALPLVELFGYIARQFRFDIPAGTLSAQLPFNFQNNSVQLQNASLSIRDTRLADLQNNRQSVIDLPELQINAITIDSGKTAIDIGQIRAGNGRLAGTLSAQREFSLQQLLTPLEDSASPAATANNPPAADWHVQLNQLALSNWTLSLTDQQPATPVNLTFNAVDLLIRDFSSRSQTLQLSLNTALESGGDIQLGGAVTLAPLTAQLKLDVAQLNLLPATPYWQNLLNIELLNATLSSQLAITLNQPAGSERNPTTESNDQPISVVVSGDAQINDLKTRDRPGKRPLLNWQETRLNNIRFSNTPLALAIESIDSDALYARLSINADKSINLQNLLVKNPDATVSPAAPAKTPTSALDLSIGDIELRNSRIDFSDYGITPNFSAGIQQLNGHIAGIGDSKKTQATIDLQGRIDAYAPVTISGQFNPDNFTRFADIAINFRNIDMTTFTPYSGTFAGYKIEKGKLSVDLHYIIENRKLSAKNGIFMDQLTLGEPVSSSTATSLPVKLAVSLLKNNKGEIDIDLPISGNIDNPAFSIRELLFKAVVNLITQTVSAPFKLLSGLVGSSEQLDTIAFQAGRATLDSSQQEKLTLLASALQKRPELYLEIARTVHEQRDLLALRTLETPATNDMASDNKNITTESPTPAEEDALHELAIERAQLIRSTLEAQGVKPKRLYITDKIRKTDQLDDGMINVELKLNSK